jgi:hypothetical protein
VVLGQNQEGATGEISRFKEGLAFSLVLFYLLEAF